MKEGKSKMRCPEARKLISALVDGELEQMVRQDLERHIAVCPPCAHYRTEMMVLREKLSALPELESPPFLFSRIEARLQRATRVRPLLRFASIAALVILILVAGFIGDMIGKYIFEFSRSSVSKEQMISEAIAPLSDAPAYSLSYIVFSGEEGTIYEK